jgi:hypothetical protein
MRDGRMAGPGQGSLRGRNFAADFDKVKLDLPAGEASWDHARIWQNSFEIQTGRYAKTAKGLEVSDAYGVIRAERLPLLTVRADKISVADGKGQATGVRVSLLNRIDVNIGNIPVKIRTGEALISTKCSAMWRNGRPIRGRLRTRRAWLSGSRR